MAISFTIATLVGLLAGLRLKLFGLSLATVVVAAVAFFAHAQSWTDGVLAAVGSASVFQIAALAAMLLRHLQAPPSPPLPAPTRLQPARR